MLDYVTLGTNDIARAARFYDPLFELLGYTRYFEDDQVISWAHPDAVHAARFYICTPFDEAAATTGNGTMTAFRAKDTDTVDRLYTTALALGGSDEGPPGTRPDYGDNFYVAYVRDPDSNKLAFCYY